MRDVALSMKPDLERNGWYLIKIEIDENLQRNRLMMTYPDHWDKHWIIAMIHGSGSDKIPRNF